jgi:hypothetical protein
MQHSPARRSPTSDACPFVNANDPRCGTRFSLGRLEQAFTVCFGTFHACPMFQSIIRERHRNGHGPAVADGATVPITVFRNAVQQSLRATGT